MGFRKKNVELHCEQIINGYVCPIEKKDAQQLQKTFDTERIRNHGKERTIYSKDGKTVSTMLSNDHGENMKLFIKK